MADGWNRSTALVLLALLLAAPRAGAAPADPEPCRSVSSPRIILGYKLADDSGDAATAKLWFTKDKGRTWQQAATSDSDGSLVFDADGDGLFGFYIVLYNTAGPSSQPPSPGTPPQQWVRVDRSAPVVQALSIRPDPRFAVNRDLHLRWSATDDNLPDRPVALHYRTEETKTFRLIADCLAPRGAYRWTVPEGSTARIELKFSATDRAGNTGTYIAELENVGTARMTAASQPAARPTDDDIAAATPTRRSNRRSDSDDGAIRKAAFNEPDAGEDAEAAAAASQSQQRYEAGTLHRLRGDYDLAIARYREAIELAPRSLPPRVDLAGVLIIRGDLDAAERELQKALVIDPGYRPALKSLALAQARRRNYKSARETLDKVLLVEPRDAEAWLAYGDVVMFMGDRLGARQAWQKAQSLAESEPDTRTRAAKRLDMYPDIRGE